MTVEVERSFDIDAPIEEVWELLGDETIRAGAIEIVERFDTGGNDLVWHIKLPIPLVRKTIAVKTRDVERNPPNYVKFVGRSKVMDVTGEHELSEHGTGTRVRNRFVVDGKVPGVEKFFSENIDGEIENIRRAVSRSVREVDD